MLKKILKSREFLSIFFAFVIFISIFTTSFLFEPINERLIPSMVSLSNNFIKSWNSSRNILNENIVVLKIDEKTTDELWRFPFDRKVYKKVIENLNNWWASVIWFDIIFADKSNEESDKILSDAIKNAWNIVLWSAIVEKATTNKIISVIEKPLEEFVKNAYDIWFFQPNLTKNTQIALTFSPFKENFPDKNYNISTYNHFALSLVKWYLSKKYKSFWVEKDFRKNFYSDDYKFYYTEDKTKGIPYASKKTEWVFINYLKPNRIPYFETYSFIDVYNWRIDPRKFKDKIIIIWTTAKGIKDIFFTTNDIEYWVFVQANIVNTILNQNYLTYFNENLEWVLVFLVIILSIYFSMSDSGRVSMFANLWIAWMFLFIYPTISIIFMQNIYKHLFELFLALPFAITIWNVIKYLFENKNKWKLSKALSEYVSKAIVKEILSNSWDIKLDWDLKKLTIFFSDIEWFTTISEKFSPEELITFLRKYLSYMSNIILDNQWFINKYEWDAIMALWWAFSHHSELDWYNACLSAIRQQELLKDLNKTWLEEWFPPIRARIWLHTWEAIVWNIWSVWRKIEFSAFWDSVNLGSRLEWVNKFYGTFICASEVVYEENKEKFDFRFLDKIKVKWKDKPIKIYELLSLKWELDETRAKIVKYFDKAMEKYFSKDFESAKKMFEEIFTKYQDPPSKTYILRCEFYIQNPWEITEDLVWKFDSK